MFLTVIQNHYAVMSGFLVGMSLSLYDELLCQTVMLTETVADIVDTYEPPEPLLVYISTGKFLNDDNVTVLLGDDENAALKFVLDNEDLYGLESNGVTNPIYGSKDAEIEYMGENEEEEQTVGTVDKEPEEEVAIPNGEIADPELQGTDQDEPDILNSLEKHPSDDNKVQDTESPAKDVIYPLVLTGKPGAGKTSTCAFLTTKLQDMDEWKHAFCIQR